MKKKQIMALFIVLIFGGSFIAYALNSAMPSQRQQRSSRALIQIITCGEEREIPEVRKQVGNSTFLSNSTGLITFPRNSEFTLGEAFDLMNTTFSKTELMEYENGNGCDNPYSNEVSVWVGGENEQLTEVSQHRNYVIKNGDMVSVRYN